jgi:hypothetical protein
MILQYQAKQDEEKQNKNKHNMCWVRLETTMLKQAQTTFIRHEPSHKKLEVNIIKIA